MSLAHFNSSIVSEMFVMFFQTIGVACLFLNRLTTQQSSWHTLGRNGVILAVLGLGIAGALCGRQDSEFALFAGGTMTVLLIGMTIGNSNTDAVDAIHSFCEAEAA
jgi:hypothetical protein